jgi:NAD(P)-dependent dehydrogenase (short-subunit alcohol dehydrogenase family)
LRNQTKKDIVFRNFGNPSKVNIQKEKQTMNKIVFDLTGKTALITGASRGIGEAIAITLADYGAECIIVSRKEEALKEVRQKIISRGGKAEVMACHMGEIAGFPDLFSSVKQRYGRLDILINNAAINPYFGEMTGIDEGLWNKILDVNLKGPFFMIKEAVPLMLESGGGSIINISSINAIRPALFQGVYSMTKAGIMSMTQAFAKELVSKNIRVNAILPGLIDTKFSKAIIENKDLYDYVMNMIPMNRPGKPHELAGIVLYLASAASSFTTGAHFPVDGGMLA